MRLFFRYTLFKSFHPKLPNFVCLQIHASSLNVNKETIRPSYEHVRVQVKYFYHGNPHCLRFLYIPQPVAFDCVYTRTGHIYLYPLISQGFKGLVFWEGTIPISSPLCSATLMHIDNHGGYTFFTSNENLGSHDHSNVALFPVCRRKTILWRFRKLICK